MINSVEIINIINNIEKQRKARKSHLAFMQYTWIKNKADPFIVGFHTKKICNKLDKAFEDFRNGISTYLIINTHHRTGKSDLISKYLGPHFLGEFPDKEVMQITYQARLSSTFSAYGRNILRSEKYKELYPAMWLSKESNKKNDWVIVNEYGTETGGKLYASGIRSGLTGSGFHLGIVDDWFAGRKEAESKVMRDNVWQAFTDDFMTRRAPVTIVIIIGTQWHADGLINRIRKEEKENKDFPIFEEMIFPARAADYKGEGHYTGEFLFTKRYSEKWYREQYATLGRYSAAALMDCDPKMRAGAILSTDGIIYHDKDDKKIPTIGDVKWAQVWDLAHTAKQTTGEDPDFTSGTLLAFQRIPGDPILHLWIKRRVRFQLGTLERDRKIKLHTDMEGYYIYHVIETSLDAKDAYNYIIKAIPEYTWREAKMGNIDKVIRCIPLEPIFEAPRHVHVIRGDWNDEWLKEVEEFTGSGKEHDDGIDNLTAGYKVLIDEGLKLSDKDKEGFAKRKRMV